MIYYVINKKRAASLLSFFMLGVFLLASCSDGTDAHFKLVGQTMGTGYHITVVDSRKGKTTSLAEQQKLREIIDIRLSVLNQQMSTYLPESELQQLNREFIDQWIPVSAELFDVLMISLEVSWLSDGAFDVTVASLVDLWGFGPNAQPQDAVPQPAQIERLRQRVGFTQLQFDLGKNAVRKLKPIRMDLSAVAKGYAVDQVAELMLMAGYTDFMVEIGGELRLQGSSPRGSPWRIAIEEPDGSLGAVHRTVQLEGVGMATSGDYRNYFEADGRRYSHTIDPRTGYPITHNLVSVTVIADSAAYADALATAINVMGAEPGLALAQQQGLAVYLLTKTEQGFSARFSDAFKPYLE